MCNIKVLFMSSTLFRFVDYSVLHSLGLLPHSLVIAFLVKYSMAVASLILWDSQDNPGFTFITSYNDFSGHPYQDAADTCLVSAAFLRCGGRLHNPFFLSLTLKPVPHGQKCRILLLAEAGTWPPHWCSMASAQFSVVNDFLQCLSSCLIQFHR